jgi:hypothetical protein
MLHYLYGPDDVVIEVTDSDDEDVIPIAEPDLLPDEDEDEDEEDDDDEDDEFDEDEDEDDEPIEPEPTDEPAVDD